ncbi:MAG: hypothetical protein E7485_06955 [Ruminococcaceae bacterium]|nr:hypothetical protein [Oscillospiraceae bacterium]
MELSLYFSNKSIKGDLLSFVRSILISNGIVILYEEHIPDTMWLRIVCESLQVIVPLDYDKFDFETISDECSIFHVSVNEYLHFFTSHNINQVLYKFVNGFVSQIDGDIVLEACEKGIFMKRINGVYYHYRLDIYSNATLDFVQLGTKILNSFDLIDIVYSFRQYQYTKSDVAIISCKYFWVEIYRNEQNIIGNNEYTNIIRVFSNGEELDAVAQSVLHNWIKTLATNLKCSFKLVSCFGEAINSIL